MRAAELIRLLEQYAPDMEVPVSFTTDANMVSVPHITTCAADERSRCYEYLVERAEDGMLVVNAGGLITYMNPYLLRLTGYSPSELIGRPLQQLLTSDDADIVRRRLCAGLPGGRRFTLRLLTRQQHSIWVQLSATPVPSSDNHFRGYMMTITNLSQQQHHLSQTVHQSLGDKVESVHDQLDRLQLLRSHLLSELEQINDQPRIDATPFWHQGRYLYLIQPQINGKRTRRYIGSQPGKVKEALAAVRQQQRYDQIQQELQQINDQIRAASFRLDSFLWELAQLPPDLHRLLPATASA